MVVWLCLSVWSLLILCCAFIFSKLKNSNWTANKQSLSIYFTLPLFRSYNLGKWKKKITFTYTYKVVRVFHCHNNANLMSNINMYTHYTASRCVLYVHHVGKNRLALHANFPIFSLCSLSYSLLYILHNIRMVTYNIERNI